MKNQNQSHPTVCPSKNRTMRCAFASIINVKLTWKMFGLLLSTLKQRGGSINVVNLPCATKKKRQRKKKASFHFYSKHFQEAFSRSNSSVRTLILFVLPVFSVELVVIAEKNRLLQETKCFPVNHKSLDI